MVLESADSAGGKAGFININGLSSDTGPSVLTMVEELKNVFTECGEHLEDHLLLRQPEPAFRYLYDDGTTLNVAHNIEDTYANISSALGSEATAEMKAFMDYSQQIWQASAPHFIYVQHPHGPR